MGKYLKYLNYILKHKWYVMTECFKQGLIWRGLLHDLSKFLPDEFFPYANHFYGRRGGDETGSCKLTDTGDKASDFAWLLHQKRNRHHWQWWILAEDEGGLKILEICEPYLTEMICDWIGAGKAQGHFSPKEDRYFETRRWYQKNGSRMNLDETTRQKVEERIHYFRSFND